MEWLSDYEEELREVFASSAGIISRFPEPLNAQGLAYLDGFNVFSEQSHKNYICYLLPFWLQKAYPLGARVTKDLALANILLMLYFFLQDDVMDGETASPAGKLSLSNLLFIEFLNMYRPLFPAESSFWTHFNRYIVEWADSVSGEAEGDYFLKDRIRIAHKASPLKLCSTAVLLLADHAEHIAMLETMLHEVLITLQMLDDYEDWEEDLAAGSRGNCLLAFAGQQGAVPWGELTPELVRNILFTRSGLASYSGIAQDNHRRLLEHEPKIPQLAAFHQTLASNLHAIAASIEAEKRNLLSGGLEYWLSKNMKES